jgi:hypothetical protein
LFFEIEKIRMSLEAGYFAPNGEESHITRVVKSVPGSTPGLRCPELASLFTPYKKMITNAVNMEILRSVEGRKAERFESAEVHTHIALLL